MSHRGLRLLLWAGTAAVVTFLWATPLPLGVPGEWTWTRIVAGDGETADRLLGLVIASVVAAVYVVGVELARKRLDSAHRSGVAVRLALLAVAGFAWLFVVQDAPPGTRRLQKSVLVLYAPSTSGYYYHDRFRVDDFRSFLAEYEAWVGQGDVLHFGTHPPGLFLLHRGLTKLCGASPPLTRSVLALQPDSVREVFELLDRFPMGAPTRLSDADRASLWLAALLTQAIGVLALVPIYLLVRRSCGRQAAWTAASLWPLVPALAVFLPKSDALYPCLGATFLWCWLEAASRRSILLGAAAGLLLFVSLGLTLAFLPVALLAAVLSVAELRCDEGAAHPGRRFAPWIAGATTFLALTGAVRLAFDLNLPAVWLQNYRNHAAFYGQFTRTWWKWLLVNPLEAAIAAGLPVALLASAAVFRAIREDGMSCRSRAATAGVALVWGMLWLSGKNSGEAARLWLPLLPWGVWLAGISLERASAVEADAPGRRVDLSRVALILQAVCAVATVLKVFGFEFGGG